MSKSDLLYLFIFILISIAVLFLVLLFNDGKGTEIIIEAKDTVIKEIPIKEYKNNKSKIYYIEGEIGISKVEVKDGKVRMLESPCPNKICVDTNWIEKPGEIIACIPNKIIIRIRKPNK